MLLSLASAAFAGGVRRPARMKMTMKMVFFPSAAAVFFPDGGTMLFDFGKGMGEKRARALREQVLSADYAFRLFSVFGWRPRIDWLMLSSRNGTWDEEILQLFDYFDITRIYFPFDSEKAGATKTTRSMLHRGISKTLLQISLEGIPTGDLSAVETLDVIQSCSGVTFRKLLPEKGQNNFGTAGKDALCAVLVYNDVRVLITNDLTVEQQEYLMVNRAADIRATVLFCPPSLSAAFIDATGASVCLPFDGATTVLTTDGITVSSRGE
jgi:hypothetical protein